MVRGGRPGLGRPRLPTLVKAEKASVQRGRRRKAPWEARRRQLRAPMETRMGRDAGLLLTAFLIWLS